MGLAESRRAAGVTRAQAAYTLHLSLGELDQLESMALEPTPRQVQCMARMYGCKPEELGLGLDPDSLHGWMVYHGVSRTGLCKMIKVHHAKVVGWEEGTRTPDAKDLDKLVRLTGIPRERLIAAEGWWEDDREEENA